jgi:TNF receptor-associated protein 1
MIPATACTSRRSPIVINALLFTPSQNMEILWHGPDGAGVSLYCKKVLIDPKPKKLLPEWMRFVRGVIDSEDLPLNISRESMQDSALVRKLGDVVMKRLLKFLDKEATDDAKKYNGVLRQDFSRFFKEGVATDHTNREAIAKLLRFESSMTEPGETIGLTDYVKRMKEARRPSTTKSPRAARHRKRPVSRSLQSEGHRGALHVRAHRRIRRLQPAASSTTRTSSP